MNRIDFAFIKNGYVYHTIYDDIEHVEVGQLQSMGNMMTDFIFNLPNEMIGNFETKKNLLIMDVLRLFTVKYKIK